MRTAFIAVLLLVAVAGHPTAAGQDRRDWLRLAVGDHFVISFEGPQQQYLATNALVSLDNAYWRIGQTLNTYPNTPIQVVLYTTEDFHDITRAPTWAAGAYDGTIRVPMRGALKQSEELDRVMAHEFTHALIQTLATKGVPTWLNEGLAAALERDSIEWANQRIRRGGGPMALTRLGGSFSELSADDANLAYATSAVAAQRMLDAAGGVAVSNLLRDLGAGQAFDEAFAHRIRRPFAAFSASLGDQP